MVPLDYCIRSKKALPVYKSAELSWEIRIQGDTTSLISKKLSLKSIDHNIIINQSFTVNGPHHDEGLSYIVRAADLAMAGLLGYEFLGRVVGFARRMAPNKTQWFLFRKNFLETIRSQRSEQRLCYVCLGRYLQRGRSYRRSAICLDHVKGDGIQLRYDQDAPGGGRKGQRLGILSVHRLSFW